MNKRTRAVQRLTLAALCLGMFMAQLDTTVVNLALPRIQASLHSGVAGLQWIIDAYNLVFASLLLTGGTLGDLFGRKRLFLLGLGLFTFGSAVCALVPSLGVLLAGRVLQGGGAAFAIPGTLAILAATFPEPNDRAWALGLWASMAGLAIAVGPTVGALLVDRFSWQSIFYLNLPIGLITILLVLRVVPETVHREGRRLDLPGLILGVLFLGGLTFGAIEGEYLGWSSPPVVLALAVSLLAGLAFVAAEHRTPAPMVELTLFAQRRFSAAIVVAALMTFGMYGMLFTVSLFLQQVQGDSTLAAGIGLLPLSLAFIAVSPVSGRLTARLGARWLMTAGMSLMGIGLLLFLPITARTSFPLIGIALLTVGVGLGLNTGAVMGVAVSSVIPSRAGMASGVANAARMVGATLGVAILGAILASALPRGITGPAVPAAFVVGMHHAFLVGGIGELLGGLVAVTFTSQPATARRVDVSRSA